MKTRKELIVVALAAFCLVAAMFLAVPGLAGTSSPPFDLYGTVKDIQTKVNTIISQLSALPGVLTKLEQELWSAANSVKNDTSDINQKLDNLDNDVSDVESKLDQNGRLGSTTQMSSSSGMYIKDIGIGEFYVVTASTNYYTSKYTVTYHVYSNESNCWANIYAGHPVSRKLMDKNQIDNPVSGTGQYETTATFECAAESVAITFTHGLEPCSLYMEWWITVESPAGTPPVIYNTTFPK